MRSRTTAPAARARFRRGILAVVRDDENAPQLRWIVDGEKALDRGADAELFVVCRDDYVEARRRRPREHRHLVAPREHGQAGEVAGPRKRDEGKQNQRDVDEHRAGG